MGGQRRIGMVSLGCPKALVDSERILTQLRTDGYEISPDYEGADVVVVNTCGFIDSAKAESLEAIGEALDANGRVIVSMNEGFAVRSSSSVGGSVRMDCRRSKKISAAKAQVDDLDW